MSTLLEVPPQALLIDGMGTLVSLAAPAPALRRELHRRLGLEVSEAQAGRALAAEIAYYRAHMGLGRDAESLQTLRLACADALRAALPGGERLDLATVLDALLSALQFEAFADARPALIRARARGARVVVVSNWDVSLAEVLERVGLAPLVDGVVTSAAIGAPKPSPEIFAHALALAAAEPARALHVGDSVAEDIAGAAACGIPALLVVRDGEPAPDGVAAIGGLDELAWP